MTRAKEHGHGELPARSGSTFCGPGGPSALGTRPGFGRELRGLQGWSLAQRPGDCHPPAAAPTLCRHLPQPARRPRARVSPRRRCRGAATPPTAAAGGAPLARGRPQGGAVLPRTAAPGRGARGAAAAPPRAGRAGRGCRLLWTAAPGGGASRAAARPQEAPEQPASSGRVGLRRGLAGCAGQLGDLGLGLGGGRAGHGLCACVGRLVVGQELPQGRLVQGAQLIRVRGALRRRSRAGAHWRRPGTLRQRTCGPPRGSAVLPRAGRRLLRAGPVVVREAIAVAALR